MSQRELIIEGARQNNLKNINLRLPQNKVIAVTGISGSGKSSLAFDTIFAEGQWRFIESISTYARLFLEKLDRPEVDAIYNIRPAIALEQKNPVRGSRSTVGTITELYDFLRLLYSKVSTPHCLHCGKEVRKWNTSEVVQELLGGHTGSKAVIIFEATAPIAEIKKRGFQRIWLKGEIVSVDSALSASQGSTLHVVLDRLVIRDEPRFADSVEMAWKEGNESLMVVVSGKDHPQTVLSFSSLNACDNCKVTLPEPAPLLFSFNNPVGACPECKGFGNILIYDEDLIVPDKRLSLKTGAVSIWEKPAYKWWKRQFMDGAKKTGLDIKKPYTELTPKEKARVFEGDSAFYGINDFFRELEGKRYKLHVRVFLSRYRSAAICPLCEGKRLKKEALAYRISGYDIADLCAMSVSRLTEIFMDLGLSPFQRDVSKEILQQIDMKLSFLHKVGLDYLTLSRHGKTLSGGEYQRVNLSTQLASRLTGTLYVLDEPTVGLHARDTERVAEIMSDLSKAGNTIIVVEHDKEIIRSSDWVVELGPGAGYKGGEIVFAGAIKEFLKADTLTSRCIRGLERIPAKSRMFYPDTHHRKKVVVYGAKGNNLKNINLKIPLNNLTAVTGVSGSGKSSLIVETLYRALAKKFGLEREAPLSHDHIDGAEALNGLKIIDQAPIGKSPRSNPTTYLKIFDLIRKLFSAQAEAKAHGYGPGYFSFNVKGGRCETCRGEGYQKLEMYFFEDIYVKCEVCNGKRYTEDALRITFNGKTIDDVLNTTVDEALGLFADAPAIVNRLSLMKEVGLGYLKLGQPATTLSGGEAQRLKICSELSACSRKDVLYILDEPTVGLHFNDIKMLIDILRRLVASGNTVVVIEHNLDLIAAADWIVDLGPDGGDKGGRIIFEGRPEDIIKDSASCTGKYLKAALQ